MFLYSETENSEKIDEQDGRTEIFLVVVVVYSCSLTCDDPEVSGSDRRVEIVVFHCYGEKYKGSTITSLKAKSRRKLQAFPSWLFHTEVPFECLST